jgi:hypothetical protein
MREFKFAGFCPLLRAYLENYFIFKKPLNIEEGKRVKVKTTEGDFWIECDEVYITLWVPEHNRKNFYVKLFLALLEFINREYPAFQNLDLRITDIFYGIFIYDIENQIKNLKSLLKYYYFIKELFPELALE